MYLNNLNVEKQEGVIVPRCLLSTLECVEIREFTGEETRTKKKIMKQKKGTFDPLMNVARYILENSLVLNHFDSLSCNQPNLGYRQGASYNQKRV